MEQLVEKYIQLRDKKAELKKEYEAKVAAVDAVMDKIEAALLKNFEQTGAESVRTKSGTAYKAVKTQASIADWDTVLTYIQEHELWNMLERRVSKQAIEQFKDVHQQLPPGINWREEVTINVRRS